MFEQFLGDERAIEGLPVRLVIALVVGVASLSVMMNTLSGLDTLGVTELDTKPQPAVIGEGERTIDVTVVTPDGEPVSAATVVAKDGTATLEAVQTAKTDADGNVSIRIHPELGPNQREGTVTLDVKPPAGGEYVDDRENTKVLVVSK